MPNSQFLSIEVKQAILYPFSVIANTSLQKRSWEKISMVSVHWCILSFIY